MILIKKFNIKEEKFTMEFLMNWFRKEYILDNALYAVGKLKINSNDLERNNKMKKRLMYLSELLKVFGFKGINDLNTTIERDDNLVQRMENSGFMKYNKYKEVMEAFGKRMYKEKETNNFSIDRYMKFTNSMLYEFGVKICKREKMNSIFYQ